MGIENLLKNYSKQVEPDAAAKKRVFNVISARMDQNNNLNIKQQSMLQKIFTRSNWYFTAPLLALSLVVVFFAPLVFLGGTNQDNLAPQIDNANGEGGLLNLFGRGYSITDEYSYDASGDYIYPSPTKDIEEDTNKQESERAKLQKGYFLLEGNDIQGKFNEVKSFAEAYEGYILSSSFTGGKQTSATVIMRVPAEKFDEVLAKIRELDLTIVSESIQTIDKQNELTESINTKSDLQKQLKDLESKLSKATDTDEKQKLETEITALKNRIQITDNQIEKLQNETEFSTIEVNLRQAKGSDFLAETGKNFQTALTFWMLVFSWIGIPLLVLVIVLVIARKVYKRKKNR